jgi:transketolase
MKFKKNNALYKHLGNCIRALTADAVEKANSGHPGMPLGMADVMAVLAFDFLKYNPHDPKWPSRDRLILSNGHGSMLLYAFYYLAGYRDFTLDDIKKFRTLHSKTPGHPEYGAYDAIETTTGPLGQGFANAVGMSIAQKKYDRFKYKIYCTVGDGCLMEGISYETASLAGHLALNNLIILFDDNQITIDGKASLSCSEDHIAKFKAFGWDTYYINGHNPEEIHYALNKAQNANKPVFIACKTMIAKEAGAKEGSEKSHGAPLGAESVQALKQNINFPPEAFAIPRDLLEMWRHAWEFNEGEFRSSLRGGALAPTRQSILNISHKSGLPRSQEVARNDDTQNNESTRVSSGKIIAELLKYNDNIICGSADLGISNNLKNGLTQPITKDDFSGNFIHYGVREHAMAGIMNGIALSGFLPIGGTFLIFSDYMKPAIRLAALMKQKIIYIFTHDSIGVGEDGTTHQPIEQLSSLRAIPNLLVMRPADYLETAECFQIALEYTGPVAFALTRQTVPPLPKREVKIETGAYIIYCTSWQNGHPELVSGSKSIAHGILKQVQDDGALRSPEITIFATGSEVQIALEVAQILHDIQVRVISAPCLDLLLKQSKDYMKLLSGNPRLKVAIEAASAMGWHQIIGEDGLFFGVEDFGVSATAAELYKYFDLDAHVIAQKIKNSLPLQDKA